MCFGSCVLFVHQLHHHYLLQLGDSLDEVYQVGIAKFSEFKPCRTNYGRFDAANLEPAPALKTSPVCVSLYVCVCVFV